MNILDISIVVITLFGFILGFKDGFVRKIIGLIGFALAIYLSIKFASQVGHLIAESLGLDFALSKIVSAIAIFFLVELVFAIIKRVIHPFDKVNNLINQLLGGVMGAAQILFFISASLYILALFDIPSKKAKEESKLYASVAGILPSAINYINEYKPETKEILDDYILPDKALP